MNYSTRNAPSMAQSCAPRNPVCVGSTAYRANSMGLGERAPESIPCGDESSGFILDGATPLDGIYASVPFDIISTDIPNNDVGAVGQFRNIVSFKPGPTDDTILTAANSNAMTFTKTGAIYYPCVGLWVNVNAVIADASAPILRIRSTGIVAWTDINTASNRDVTIQLKRVDPTFWIFLPMATVNIGTNVWAPSLAVVSDNSPARILVDGLGTPAGSTTARFVGPSSTVIASVLAAMVNANLSAVG